MKILFCGKFNPEYNRTRIIIEGLKRLGNEITVYNYRKKRLVDKEKLKSLADASDIIFLPSFTHTDVPFVRKLSSKPLVFDPLISRYLSKVFDYQTISKNSPRALKNFLKDSRSLKKADLVLADTFAHKFYFIDKFKIPAKKIKVIPIGVITEDFFPIKVNRKLHSKTIIGFYGSFIPLHGIDIILKAARILNEQEEFLFRFIGDGILVNEIEKLSRDLNLKNVEFMGWKSYEHLNEEINKFDIALGIFGSSQKARMVIPNKIFHYAACSKPIITMESEAIKEVFTRDKNICLCKNDPEDLAENIIRITDTKYNKTISANAHRLVTKKYNETKIASSIMEHISTF